MKPFWEGAVLHQAINELHSAEKTTKQLLNGQRSHNDGPLASWPVTDVTHEATYLADLHDRLKNEEEENEGIGYGEQEEGGEASKIKKRRRAQTVNPSHISNLLQYEIERQKEMIARDEARFQDFKTRLQFSRYCYDHGLRNAAVVCDSGNMSAEATGIFRQSISETMHLFHTGKLPTQEVEGEGGEQGEVKREEGEGKEEEEGEVRKEGKRELMDGES